MCHECCFCLSLFASLKWGHLNIIMLSGLELSSFPTCPYLLHLHLHPCPVCPLEINHCATERGQSREGLHCLGCLKGGPQPAQHPAERTGLTLFTSSAFITLRTRQPAQAPYPSELCLSHASLRKVLIKLPVFGLPISSLSSTIGIKGKLIFAEGWLQLSPSQVD